MFVGFIQNMVVFIKKSNKNVIFHTMQYFFSFVCLFVPSCRIIKQFIASTEHVEDSVKHIHWNLSLENKIPVFN